MIVQSFVRGTWTTMRTSGLRCRSGGYSSKITADTVDAAIDTLENLSDIFAQVLSLAIKSVKNLGNYA
jgi:hypothetical protein